MLTRLRNAGSNAYTIYAGMPAMVINALRNKRCGPGGSARRLHQLPPLATHPSGSWREGTLRGRNRIDVRSKGNGFRSVGYRRYRSIYNSC